MNYNQLQTLNQPNTKKLIKQSYAYSESLAASLILYTPFDKAFSAKLKKITMSLPGDFDTKKQLEINKDSVILLPMNQASALRRAEWLIKKIKNNSIADAVPASALLKSWARTQTLVDPKQLIVGVIQVAIPGITLGKFNDKFPMTIIIRNDLADNLDLKTSHQISKASLGVLAKDLKLASGNVKKLEPEIADWFSDEKKLLFYSADENEINNIVLELHSHSITHSIVRNNDKISVLAISPAVNRVYQSKFWKIEPLEN